MKNNPLSDVSIACSGFEEPELSELVQRIQRLGGKFDINLKKSTSYLISNKINTDKCLTAVDHGKKIMKRTWLDALIRSKNGEIKEEDHCLKCFGGIVFILLGYRKEDYQLVEKNILNHDGLVTKSIEQAEIIIMKNTCINTEEAKLLENYSNKIVIERWYEDCIANNKYLKPDTYLFSKESFKKMFDELLKKHENMKNDLIIDKESNDIIIDKKEKNDENEIKTLQKGLKSNRRSSSKSTLMHPILIPTFNNENTNNIISMDIDFFPKSNNVQSSFHIFKKLIFYISDDYEKSIKEVIFKAISFGYGVVLNKISAFTTHIITQTNRDNFLNHAKFNKVSKPLIVNHQWLIDSLNSRTLSDPGNYLPISILEFENQKIPHVNVNVRIHSYIFKGQTFTIIKDSFSKEEYEEIVDKIKSNSGNLLEENGVLDKSKHKKASYIIINDASNQLTDVMEKKESYQIVLSHRFIDKCISDNKLLRMEEMQYIHLLPLSFKVPLKDFQDLHFHFYGLKKDEINILEHVVEMLGAKCILSKKTTHIVGNEISNSQKEKYKNKYNQDFSFINSEWIIECLIHGCHYKEDKYLL